MAMTVIILPLFAALYKRARVRNVTRLTSGTWTKRCRRKNRETRSETCNVLNVKDPCRSSIPSFDLVHALWPPSHVAPRFTHSLPPLSLSLSPPFGFLCHRDAATSGSTLECRSSSLSLVALVISVRRRDGGFTVGAISQTRRGDACRYAANSLISRRDEVDARLHARGSRRVRRERMLRARRSDAGAKR